MGRLSKCAACLLYPEKKCLKMQGQEACKSCMSATMICTYPQNTFDQKRLANVDVKTLLVEEIYHLADINTKTKITWKKDCWMLAASVISKLDDDADVIDYFTRVLEFTNDQLIHLHVLYNEQALLLPRTYQGLAQVIVASKKRKREDHDHGEGPARKKTHT